MSYNYRLLVMIEKSYLNTKNHTYILMKEVFILFLTYLNNKRYNS